MGTRAHVDGRETYNLLFTWTQTTVATASVTIAQRRL